MQHPAAGVDLESLETRIQQATELIARLKSEREVLLKSQRELEARLRRLENAAGSTAELRRRAQEAETRAARYAQERGTLARRVEQMLEKLRAVEEDKVGVSP